MGDMAEYYRDYFMEFEDLLEEDTGKKCRDCGTEYLEWVKTPLGWRLSDIHGKLHGCKEYRDRMLRALANGRKNQGFKR